MWLTPILGAVQGILGGTFDPPHVAHLVAAEAAYRQFGLNGVTFLPAGAPWQKAGRPVSSADHRWEMTQLAIADVPYFDADDREVRRDGWTYTADTLATMDDDARVLLILGADAALGLPTWHRYEEVLDRAQIAVVPRPGVDPAAFDSTLAAGLFWVDAPELTVSGTELRLRVSEGRSIRFLVRDAVWRYIEDQGLYRDDE